MSFSGFVRYLARLYLLLCACSAFAAESFVVSDIKVLGVERIAVGTVLNYLPVRAGDELVLDTSSQLIRELYATGLFSDVQLARQGDILVVTVQERASITEIEITGNHLLKTEDLEKSLEQMGLARGRVFNPSMLETLQQELRNLYFSRGYYAVRITATVVDLDRNRVGIKVDISEGKTSLIRKISVLGNQVFSDDELLAQMDSGIPGPFSFWSSADEYSRSKLTGDLERLKSYYQDRGYIRFDIVSTQVTISDDKSEIYITINVDEGEPYHVTDVKLAGNLPVDESILQGLLKIKSGAVFSRQAMTDARKAIADRIEEEGYAFANINVVPDINDVDKSVALTFFVDPGQRVYVRRISYVGQTKTLDYVLRREMRQFEGGWYSPKLVNRSKVRLQRLSFIESVDIDTKRVPGSDDQLDLEVKIVERASGSFNIGVGYSSSQGVLLNLGLTHENMLGTGNRVDVSFDNSSSRKQLSFKFTDPYFTEDGVSRTYSVFARESDASKLSSTSSYLSNAYGAALGFGIPLSEFMTLRLEAGVQHTEIFTTDSTPDHIDTFIADNDDVFNVGTLNASLVYDTRNRTIFAESGSKQVGRLEYAIPQSDLDYYKLGYEFEYFHPLYEHWLTGSFRTTIDYGGGYGGFDELPFFEKYFTGGVRSLRGYRAYSLGPKDSAGDAMGGDFRTVYTLELIFPPPWVDKPGNTRFSLFYDAGNVFADMSEYDAGELRTAAGVSFNWLSPIGPLVFSWAWALNAEEEDRTENFQFSIGTLF